MAKRGILRIAGVAGLLAITSFVAPPQVGSPYGTCKGSVNVGAGTLTCKPQQCPPGCVKSTVHTAFGDGQACFCNYIGPQPFCCTIVHLGYGAYTTWGDCASAGCPQGEVCYTIGEGGGVVARCLN